jgi:hypothetical protein
MAEAVLESKNAAVDEFVEVAEDVEAKEEAAE